MDNTERKNINLEPLHDFFNEDFLPVEFAVIIDNFLYHYIQLLVTALNNDKSTVVIDNTAEFIIYLKSFRDALLECE